MDVSSVGAFGVTSFFSLGGMGDRHRNMGKGMMRIIFHIFPVPVPDLTCAFRFAGCGNLFLVVRYAGQDWARGTYRDTSDYDAGGS